jgi:hypothetical protein
VNAHAPLGTRHPFTSSIISFFASTKPGAVVTDAQISAACGAGRDRWSGLMATVAKALRPCSPTLHERVKRDTAEWSRLPLVGTQPTDDGPDLELRNCPCGSTLAREVKA